MGKFDRILICTDLDGTLLGSDKRVSAENRRAIEYFTSQGGAFTFVTGRPACITRDIYEMVHPNVPFACFNGGAIYDGAKQEYLWKSILAENSTELVDYVLDNIPYLGIQYNTADDIYFYRDNSASVNFRMITGWPFVEKHHSQIDEPLMKIIFTHSDPELLKAAEDKISAHPIAAQFSFVKGASELFEMLPKGNGKWLGLTKLAELLGIDMRRTIALGDYDNDISMLKAAGVGIAVANALEEAKAAADRITVSNDEHAIAVTIDELDRGIIKL